MMALGPRKADDLDIPSRFMALSITCFVIGMCWLPFRLPGLAGAFTSLPALAFVHLFTLGCIGAMVIGASYQLAPVMLQTELASARWARASFWMYAVGLVIFEYGLLRPMTAALGVGGMLLGITFVIYAAIIVATSRRSPHLGIVELHLPIGALFSLTGMTLGVLLALNKHGGRLGTQTVSVLQAHILVMLAGWIGITFLGVAAKLIGMFTLAERHLQLPAMRAMLACASGGVFVFAMFVLMNAPAAWRVAGALLIVVAIALAAWQVARMYRKRMRRAWDVHAPFAMLALASLGIAAILLAWGSARHVAATDPLWRTIVWLTLMGGFVTAIQGFFYKIATFLIWLVRYAPVAGTQKVPMLEQMYHRRVAWVGGGAWLIGIVGVTVWFLAGWTLLVVAIPALLVGAAAFLFNVVMIAGHVRAHASPLASPTSLRNGSGAPIRSHMHEQKGSA